MKKRKKGMLLFLTCTLVCTSLGEGQIVVFATEEEREVDSSYVEEDVISYFETLQEEVEEEMGENSITDSILESCATFILFLSNEKEIKGYTWSTLSEDTKQKIVDMYLKMDKSLEEKYPDYMKNVKVYGKKAKDFVSKTYSELKEKANEKVDEYIREEKQEEMSSKVQEGMDALGSTLSKVKEKTQDWARKKSR